MKPIVTVLATGFFLAMVAHAQLPNAPQPNVPTLTAVYSTPSPTNTASAMLAWNVPPDSAAPPGATNSSNGVSLYTVVDLALRNSNKVRIAEADQQRARGVWMETRDVYIPNFSVGSGLGYSYGFPLGNPTLFDVTSNFLLFSFSQKDYIRSAQATLKASTYTLKNTRQQVILDATLNYIELNKTVSQIAALQQALADSNNLVGVVEDRFRSGLASKMDLIQAKLTRAQTQLNIIHMEDHAQELRQHLSGLTGLDTFEISPIASTIPPLPSLDFQSLLQDDAKAPSVQAAVETAYSTMYNARGDKKAQNLPIVYGAFQYSRFSSFNGYQNYYLAFQANNLAVGIQATWPLFDRTRHDKAVESAAIAEHDRQTAELAKIQNDEGNLALWHSLRELEAQEQVSDLQQQLSQLTLSSMVTQMNQGSASGSPVTPQQADQSRIEERARYVALRDAQFNVTKVKLDLLNAIGGLEDWAKQSGQPQPASGAATPAIPSH